MEWEALDLYLSSMDLFYLPHTFHSSFIKKLKHLPQYKICLLVPIFSLINYNLKFFNFKFDHTQSLSGTKDSHSLLVRVSRTEGHGLGLPPGMESRFITMMFEGQKKSEDSGHQDGWGGSRERETRTHNHVKISIKMKELKEKSSPQRSPFSMKVIHFGDHYQLNRML